MTAAPSYNQLLKESETADQIIDFLISLVNREDLIAKELEEYSKIKAYEPDIPGGKSILYLPLYRALERFVADHEPLVVKQKFTIAELREKIKKTAPVEMLSEEFKKIFY